MSIKPLDLQTMFVRLNEVGKEQSHNQQATALQQNQEARKLVEQALLQDNSVDSTTEDKETRSVEDKEADNGKKEEGHEEAASLKEEKKKQKIVQDPDMGIHIDISG